jgi:hypothetical protein
MAELYRASNATHTSAVVSTVLAADAAQGATALVLAIGAGAGLPSPSGGDFFHLRLGTNSSNEVVRVTARSGDVLTCTALGNAWASGTPAIWTVSAETLEKLQEDIKFPLNAACTGTAPVLVGTVRLKAGSYAAPWVCIGCSNPANAATLKLTQNDGTVLLSVGGSAGGLAWVQAGSGLTLSVDTQVNMWLSGGTAATVALAQGFEMEKLP